jgi:histone-lysine N-methyltransferase ASH1L
VSATKTTKTVTATESSPARKRPSKAKKNILKGVRETINKGTTKQSPRAKSSSTRTTARSPRARK